MPIVIKEVIVKTTVERSVPQETSLLPDTQFVDRVKRQVLAELPNRESALGNRKYKKDR
ncbi:DUF5908 family protein [Bacteroides sp.]